MVTTGAGKMKKTGLIQVCTILLMTSLTTCSIANASAQNGRRWAMVIGIEDYQYLPTLSYAIKDANLIADTLVGYAGFPAENVVVMTSAPNSGKYYANNRNIILQLDRLSREIRTGDTFVLYFSGHGFSFEGRQFLATVETDNSSLARIEVSSLPLELLERMLKRVKPSQFIFIVDACRNHPGAEKSGFRQTPAMKSAIVERTSREDEATRSGILFSCSEGEYAWEDPEKGFSLFSYHLVEYLRSQTGRITMADLGAYVKQKVRERTRNSPPMQEQNPVVVAQRAAEIVLAEADRVIQPGRRSGGVIQEVPTTAKLDIKTNPAGAVIIIDGQEVSRKLTPVTIEVPLGVDEKRDVEVGLRIHGYEDIFFLVPLERGRQRSLNLNLKLSKRPSREVQMHVDRGWEYLNARRYAEAEAQFREAIKEDPNNPLHHNNLGFALYPQRKYEQAEAAFREALRLNPKQYISEANLGLTLIAQKKFEAAVDAYRNALRMKPETGSYYYYMGFALYKLGRYEEAETAMRESVRLSPSDPSYMNNLGDVLYALNSLEEAATMYREAVRLEPSSALYRVNLAAALFKLKRYADAEKALRAALLLEPDNGGFHEQLGLVLMQLEKWSEAEQVFRESVRLRPNDGSPYANLASALYRQSRIEEAREQAQKAIERGLRFHWVYRVLGIEP
jgi:tetratricopeptide (TPR) repeat protein/uncharacterized caspase-like protein